MISFLQRYAYVAGLAALGLVLVWALHTYISLHKERIGRLNEVINAQNNLISFVESSYERLQSNVAYLITTQEHVREGLYARQTEIARLQTEVAEIRDWANTPLPVDIERLRQRPALSGAASYSELMPKTDTMHTQPQ